MKRFHSLSIPRSNLVGAEDRVPPGDEDWHARMARRLGSHRFVEIAGGHEALFTKPTVLERELLKPAGPTDLVSFLNPALDG